MQGGSKSSEEAGREACSGELGGGAGCGYHYESDLAGLDVTVPLYFKGELFLKQNITQQCLEEMKSAQNLNLPTQCCTVGFHNGASGIHCRLPRSRHST